MVDLELHKTEVIIANALGGVVLLAILPTVFGLVTGIGIPNGRGESVALGFYIALVLAPFVLFGLAYQGYTERE